MKLPHILNKTLGALAMAALTTANVYAGTVSQTPLFLSNAAEPNLILGIDNSGSMDFEVLAPTNDGAYWWNENTQSFVGCDVNDNCSPTPNDTFNFNAQGNAAAPWDKYPYLFPFPGVNIRNGGYSNNSCNNHAHFFIPPIPAFAWARSPQYNNAYFNPNVTYTPWVNFDGSSMGNISSTAAPDDPFVPSSATLNLTSPQLDTSHGFMLQTGMTLPAGTTVWQPKGNSNNGASYTLPADDPMPDINLSGTSSSNNTTYSIVTCSNGNSSQYLPIQYFPATFWIRADNAADAIIAAGPGYSSFSSSAVLGPGQGPAGATEPMWGFEIKPANFSNSAQYNAAIQNFANWFSYYRKRHLALRASLSQTFVGLSAMRVGCAYMDSNTGGCPVQGSGSNITMYDMSSSSNKQTLFSLFLNNNGAGGTPTWNLLNYIGQQYQRTDSSAPITQACQKNFAMIFTDGYADYPYPTSSSPVSGSDNIDGTMGSPYADNTPGTLADVASYYYLNNLRPDRPTGLVTPDSACGTPNAPPGLDCNTNLHMDTYAVTLVQQGLIWNVNQPATQNPFQNQPPWPTPAQFANRNPTGIDDLWHATLDSRGQMFAAQTPQLIASQLQNVLNSIAARTSSASAIATNSTRLSTNTFIYQARFQTTDWTGSLRAFQINSDGSIAATATWDAAQQIPASGSRNIVTWAPTASTSVTGAGVPFEWANLNATQQAALNVPPASATPDNLGSDRVTWLRGGPVPSSDGFRIRSAPLGDIVDSNPLFVQDANFAYNMAPATVNGVNVGAGTYSSYFVNNENRLGVLYVGANDGMLHAFNAANGQELFAFVPNTVIPRLNNLMSQNYPANHQFYVDGSPTVGDAYINSAWGTYLVGDLGAGGAGVFALNVTNPQPSSETAAASMAMWEVNNTTTGYADLGYTIPRASIALMANGQYAAIVSNGFDSATGVAALFIINLANGQLIREIKTTGSTTSPNGLAAATPVDINNDRVTDYIYAGDLQGNLWKFDVTSTNPASWCVSNDTGGCTTTPPTPFFKAVDSSGNPQPITVRPVIGVAANSSTTSSGTPPPIPQIYFGTGKYFENGDNVVGSSPQVQTFYSVIDNGTGTGTGTGTSTGPTRSQLLQQQILTTQTVTAGSPPVSTTIRVTTNNPTSGSMSQPGWYMDLISPVAPSTTMPGTPTGERVVSDAELDNGRIVFTTLIPSTNPCTFGGTSFLMELNAFTGARLTASPFDLNGDGHFNSGDFVTVIVSNGSGGTTTITVPVSGQQSTVGIIQTPAIISASSMEYKFVSGSTGQIESIKESLSSSTGRQSWVQLQ